MAVNKDVCWTRRRVGADGATLQDCHTRPRGPLKKAAQMSRMYRVRIQQGGGIRASVDAISGGEREAK